MRSGPLRSKANSAVTCAQPPPSAPINASLPKATFSKKTSQNWLSPVRSLIGRTVMPGNDKSTITWDRPFCRSAASPDVRTKAIMKWPLCALLVQIFWPFNNQPVAVGVARLRTLAKSEPEPGSLMPMQKKHSPRQMGGIYCCFCSSVPYLRMSGALCRSAIQCEPTGAPAFKNSSTSTYRAKALRPPPP